MSKILSQDEIDLLLSTAPDADASVQAGDPVLGGVITYNFRRPDRVSKEQMRSLHFLHDRFARNVATSLAAYLRTMTEFSIVSVEQFSYSEFLMSLSDPTAYYAISMSPLDTIGALELNPTVAFTVIDRMLGGSGTGAPPPRALTEIEQNVVDAVVKLILDNLTETWRSVFELQFRIHARETRPQMLQVAGPNEVVILLVFDLKVGDIRGMLNLCIPASAIEATGSAFVQGWHRTRREPTPMERLWLYENLGRVPIGVTATIDTWLKARELVQFERGDVINLGVPVQTPVSALVGNRAKFKGHLTAHDATTSLVVESTSAGHLALAGEA
jgi:flagellar motor switch protein FliM